MKIERAISTYLMGKSTVIALVGTGVYPFPAPASASYPFITFQLITEEHSHSMSGAVGLTNPVMQIDIWSESFSDQMLVSEAVRNALDGFRGDMGSDNLNIRNCFLQNRASFTESESEGRAPVHRSSMDFSIWHVETVPTL